MISLCFAESSCDADGRDFSEATLGVLCCVSLCFAGSFCDMDGMDFFSEATLDVFCCVYFSFAGSSYEGEDGGFSLLEATLGEGEVMEGLDFLTFAGVSCLALRLFFLSDLQGDSLSKSDDELDELDDGDELDELEELDSILSLGVLFVGCPHSVAEHSCHRVLLFSRESHSRLTIRLASESKRMGSPS